MSRVNCVVLMCVSSCVAQCCVTCVVVCCVKLICINYALAVSHTLQYPCLRKGIGEVRELNGIDLFA